MKPSERLIARLRAMGVEIPEGATIRRTHAGYWQKAQAAWSWFVADANGKELGIGSQISVTELLREKRLCAAEAYSDCDISIDPMLPGDVPPPRGAFRNVWIEPE